MIRPINELIQDYDMLALKNLYAQWDNLDARGRFACIRGCLWQREYKEAEALLKKHKSYFVSESLYPLLRLNIDRETKGKFAESLATALSTDLTRLADPFVRSEYLFSIGLALLQYENYDLAIEFYRRSLAALPPGFEAYVWRAQFNIAIAELKMAEFAAFEKTFAGLESTFVSLTTNAQAYLARLLIWIYLYRNDEEKARTLLARLIPEPGTQSTPLDYRVSFLLKYKLFSSLKSSHRSDYALYFQYYKDLMAVKDQEWALALNSCAVHCPRTMPEVQERVDLWLQTQNLLDLQMLNDALLNQICRGKDFELLAMAYKYIEEKCLPLKVNLPASDLREYGLIAYRELNRKNLFKALYKTYLTKAPIWKIENFQKTLSIIEAKQNIRNIVLDLVQESLISGDHSVSLKRRPKVLALLREVFPHKAGILVHDLGLRLYGQREMESHHNRIAALIFSTRHLLGFPFLEMRREKISVHKTFRPLIRGHRGAAGKARSNELLHFMLAKKDRFSIRELSSSLNYPRRTIQANLKELVRKGQIQRAGRGRASVYFYKR